jgi:hypothetical protein
MSFWLISWDKMSRKKLEINSEYSKRAEKAIIDLPEIE